jgi:hypothetical protein
LGQWLPNLEQLLVARIRYLATGRPSISGTGIVVVVSLIISFHLERQLKKFKDTKGQLEAINHRKTGNTMTKR